MRVNLLLAHCSLLGSAYHLANPQQLAGAAFREALAAGYPEEVKCHSWLSFCFDRLGQNEEALREIETVVRLQPTSDSYFNRGRLLQGIGHIEQALQSFQQCADAEVDACEHTPESPPQQDS